MGNELRLVFSKLRKSVKHVFKNVDLSKNCTFKIGGKARIMAEPESVEELIKILDIVHTYHAKFAVIGNASNVLFDDSGYDGVIIKTTRLNRYEFHGKTLIAECGTNLNALVIDSVNRGLKGLEDGYLIPATVGGAVRMNASSSKFVISDVVEEVLVFSEGKIKLLTNEECEFGYRTSRFKNGDIILRVQFSLEKGDKKALKSRLNEIVEYRKSIVPNLPSAGCVFKNPPCYSAGKLIEDSCLKGYAIGGAMVSPKHANIITNCEGASSWDVKNLVEHIQKTVKHNYDIDLEKEIIYIE